MMLLAEFFDAHFIRWVVWVGLVVLTVALLLLIRTRWGQSQPLGKCVVLSLLAHLLLGIYMTTVNIVTATVGSPDGEGIQVALVDGSAGRAPGFERSFVEPWSLTGGPGAGDAAADTPDADLLKSLPSLPPASEPERGALDDLPLTATSATPPRVPSGDEVAPPQFTPGKEAIARPVVKEPEPIEMPSAKDDENRDLVPPPEQPKPEPAARGEQAPGSADRTESSPRDAKSGSPSGRPLGATTNETNTSGKARPSGGSPSGAPSAQAMPAPLQQRVGDHLQAGKGFGATQESEAAVKEALRWLAANQSGSGRWNARSLGGGAGRAADAEERPGAGLQADAGITGLALLAFLAAGHTHLQGPHQTTVRRGLEYLLSVQDAEGCLGATTNKYERMYCHAMATCALSEAFAMSGDQRLAPGVRKAIQYTLRAQDRATGGWRYFPSDPGDTSQLGWQVMALKSAELAGIPIPSDTRDGIGRFLKSVTAGRSGGLAFYQPNRPIVTRSMTAEALVCRQFMSLVDNPQALGEASGLLLQELPGSGQTNHYYWYYATLCMYQMQGEPWRRWNEALQKSLLGAQRHDGALAGSWDPDPVWGGCGGRAYSTALATLCLEVYYRFLPLYVEAAGRDRHAR